MFLVGFKCIQNHPLMTGIQIFRLFSLLQIINFRLLEQDSLMAPPMKRNANGTSPEDLKVCVDPPPPVRSLGTLCVCGVLYFCVCAIVCTREHSTGHTRVRVRSHSPTGVASCVRAHTNGQRDRSNECTHLFECRAASAHTHTHTHTQTNARPRAHERIWSPCAFACVAW